MAAKSSARKPTCQTFQDQMARRRERDFWRQRRWDDQVRYYEVFDKANNKFEDWTSPRYYESNNRMLEEEKARRAKLDGLDKRRERLRRLLAEERASHEVELTAMRAKTAVRFRDIPVELLNDVNVGLKLAEDDRRRHEAELNLYHQWRNDNPAVREAERAVAQRELKMTWLDQQIEKRMAREREREECRRQLSERDERIELERRKEQDLIEEAEARNKRARDDVAKQMEELKLKQQHSDDLKRREDEEARKRDEICLLQDKHRAEEARRKNEECALHNVASHKLKLRQRARDVEENVKREVELAKQILASEAADRVRDANARKRISDAILDFLELSAQQRQLEKRRRDHLDFVFDSEAKLIYEKQERVWAQEAAARRGLIDDVLAAVRSQIEENIERNRDEQVRLLEEREEALRAVEHHETELREAKRLQEVKRREIREEIDAQVKEKRAGEKQLRALERGRADVELDGIRKEEERLKKEIIKIQNVHAPLRQHARKKPWH